MNTTLTSFQQRLLEILTDYLRAGTKPMPLTYQAVAQAMDPDVNPNDRRFKRLTRALDFVNQYEAEHDRPLPGAMVVRASDGQPGEGFYLSALKSGRKFDNSKPPGSHHVGAPAIAYWREELAALIDFWTAPERQEQQESQLDRIESKLDRIIKVLEV
jgi:hypothetical protein